MAILDITNNEEYKNILRGNKVLVIYSASFCKPCKEIYPYMLELSETYKDIIFIKVDIQKCEDIEDINSILSIPHFRFINRCQQKFNNRVHRETKIILIIMYVIIYKTLQIYIYI